MCVNGMWGTVSSSNWDTREATVVCKQLGYQNSSEICVCTAYTTILLLLCVLDSRSLDGEATEVRLCKHCGCMLNTDYI